MVSFYSPPVTRISIRILVTSMCSGVATFGGGQNASAEGASYSRGVRVHAHPENFEI